jgi:hypothetical protein
MDLKVMQLFASHKISHRKPSTAIRCRDSARVEIGYDRTAGCAASLDAARAPRLDLRGRENASLRTMLAGEARRSSQVQPIEQPCHRSAMPAAIARRSELPLGQLVSDLLDRQVARLDQDRPQRLCISIRFALVLLRLLGGAELNASALATASACLVLIEMLRRSFLASAT